MSNFVLETPVKLRLPPEWRGSSVEKKLRDDLGYEDRSVTMEWRRFRDLQKDDDRRLNAASYQPSWWVAQNGREALDRKVEELDKERYKTALFSDAQGLYTYSGLAGRLSREHGLKVERSYQLPAPKPITCENPLKDPRYYQDDGVRKMVEAVHAGVELPTGSGKSLMIAMLCRHFGLPTVVATPTLSIATQLYDDLLHVFGKRYVGKYFDSKKQSDKLFVVACTKSLVRVNPEDADWAAMGQRPVLIFDESHLSPAETLAKTVLRLFANAPYRFFLSGTQLRGDGRDIVLEGITGDIVLEIALQRLVQEGLLARPQFVQYMTTSTEPNPFGADPLKLGRVHFYKNDKIYRHAGNLLTMAARAGRRPLVLMQEVDQFRRLLPHLKASVGFAYGGADAKQKKVLPERFHKSDPQALVKAFDASEIEILAGIQSCIGVGTDIKTANFIVDLVNDGSETRFRQNVGRGTRIEGGKFKFWYVSYGISNVPILHRQAEKRRKYMEDIYPPVTVQEF